ncbi:MAG: helix-turn-helix domain-containing protein [Pseudomonadota bacterium]
MIDRKSAFGDVLRNFRSLRGMTQLDLAARSQTTQRYVSFLENGRAAPGRDVVTRLAASLELNAEQSALLLSAAGYAIGLPNTDIPPGVRSVVGRVLRQQEPFPAFLLDTAQNILDTNESVEKLFAFAEKEGGVNLAAVTGRPNLLRLCLHEAGLFPFIVDPGAFISAVLGRVLREAKGDAEALSLVSEVSHYPHIRRIDFERRPPSAPPILAEHYRIGGTEFGLVCLVTSVGVPGSAEAERLRIEQFLPADETSETVIRDICEG